ncbi:sulfurtransferase TusA family protein [Acidisoma silvae]|uniref:Sulfurtransferase TusA family protein n=2 Tax=Acidisoma silvae TaxID=2802396 RepID=A0A963YS72_9PROT|nr:sulfurtransferase TusA family protein [Acidisoma silvae]MCB8875423.1 sulfurtransferase TusA family protein [Acidisoma silvae]
MNANTAEAAFLDVTTETCPMTFVRTRLMLERLAEGSLLRVRLRGAEPRDSVPRMVAAQGHAIVESIPDADPDVLEIVICRGPKA